MRSAPLHPLSQESIFSHIHISTCALPTSILLTKNNTTKMFENGFLGLFKPSNKQEEPQPTWNATTMTMEQPANYTGNQADKPAQSSQEEQQMKLRGGGGCFDVCCGCCAGILAFECCEDCC